MRAWIADLLEHIAGWCLDRAEAAQLRSKKWSDNAKRLITLAHKIRRGR